MNMSLKLTILILEYLTRLSIIESLELRAQFCILGASRSIAYITSRIVILNWLIVQRTLELLHSVDKEFAPIVLIYDATQILTMFLVRMDGGNPVLFFSHGMHSKCNLYNPQATAPVQ